MSSELDGFASGSEPALRAVRRARTSPAGFRFGRFAGHARSQDGCKLYVGRGIGAVNARDRPASGDLRPSRQLATRLRRLAGGGA